MNSTWLFNLGADIYAWFTASAAWRGSAAALASRLEGLGEARIVDLGCGPGVSTFELARRLPQSRLIGLDIAPRMLRKARRRQRAAGIASPRIRWVRADAAHLPFDDESVDA